MRAAGLEPGLQELHDTVPPQQASRQLGFLAKHLNEEPFPDGPHVAVYERLPYEPRPVAVSSKRVAAEGAPVQF